MKKVVHAQLELISTTNSPSGHLATQKGLAFLISAMTSAITARNLDIDKRLFSRPKTQSNQCTDQPRWNNSHIHPYQQSGPSTIQLTAQH